MEINNLKIILNFLKFNSSDDFYFLQIIKRKKDNPKLSGSERIIKSYYIKSEKELFESYPEIINLCKFHNARAYIRLTPRSFEKITFAVFSKITNSIIEKTYNTIYKIFDSACGEYSSSNNRIWIVDVDLSDFNLVLTIAEEINKIPGNGNPNTLGYIKTPNGWHILTTPFNIKILEPTMCKYKIDIQKNNPTLLYYDNNL